MEKNMSKNKKIIIAVRIIVLVAAVCLIAFFNTKKDNSEINKNDASPTPVASVEATTEPIVDYGSLAALTEKYGFSIGTVINYDDMSDTPYQELIKKYFNSITCGNEMKAYSMLDQNASMESTDDTPCLNYSKADEIVGFAEQNGIGVRGHVLVWDAYMCDWFFREGYTNDGDYVNSKTLKKRLKSYIEQVITHFEETFPKTVYCWDVVNEGVGDNEGEYKTSDPRHVRTLRNGESNPFYEIIGKDYIELSFLYAKETVKSLKADIKLFYNDYNAFQTEKRDAICELVKSINQSKMLCDGVGMQGYIGGYGSQNGCMNYADITKVKTAITMYGNLGVDVHVTEMSLRNYENTEEMVKLHAEFYKSMFEAFMSVNTEEKDILTNVSIWGICDNPNSEEGSYGYMLNGPYCGLFTEDYQIKDAFKQVYEVLSQGK